MSASGAKVLMLRSVELARNHGVRIHARSTFSDEEGTWVQEGASMEQPIVSAVTHSENDVVFTLSDIPDRPGVAALIFDVVGSAHVNVDTIIQNVVHGNAEMSFSVPTEDVPATNGALESTRAELGDFTIEENHDLGKVSLIGAGHALAPGRRGEDVPHARRQRDQPADDLHVTDQDLLHDRPLGDPERRPRAARRVRARERADPRGVAASAQGGSAASPPNHARRWNSPTARPRRSSPARSASSSSSPCGSRSTSPTTATRGACSGAIPVAVARRRTTFHFARRVIVALVATIAVWSVLSLYDVTSEIAKALLASSAVLALFAGLAFSTPLSNLGSGLLVAFTQPLRLGDRITVDGETGFVEEMALIYTTLVTDDARRVFIPNTQLTTSKIVNRTIKDPAAADRRALPRLDRDADRRGARRAPRMRSRTCPERTARAHACSSARSPTAPSGSRSPTYGPIDADVVSLASELRERGLGALREKRLPRRMRNRTGRGLPRPFRRSIPFRFASWRGGRSTLLMTWMVPFDALMSVFVTSVEPLR